MTEDQMTSPLGGPASADSDNVNPEGASTDLQADNTRLRQELAKSKQVQNDVLPFVQFAVAVRDAPGGKAIIEKANKARAEGKPLVLTDLQEEKVAAAAKATDTPVSEEKLGEILNGAFTQFEQRLFEKDKATEAIQGIYARGKEELPGYENLYKTPEWRRRKAVILTMAQQDPSMVPDDESDPYWWIEKETYATLAAQNPDIGKVKPAKKTESERRGAIAGVSHKSAGAPEETEDGLPDYVKKLRDGTNRPGKTLANYYGGSRKR